ncbi:immunoglobulin-like domain-containing protein [Tissierella sp.]|uniref:immunoglobulin-like domain-containing protein n=1 Tax=Tissierella sp. TaxID=41274 RepID=UPI0028A5A1EF|nr:immunoglobulin-like domain-containing protein [Tissierella sp.]
MKIKEGTLSTVGVTVILESKLDNEYIYGEFFSLEKKINDRWYQLPGAYVLMI